MSRVERDVQFRKDTIRRENKKKNEDLKEDYEDSNWQEDGSSPDLN